jgi:hypothetical protein
MKLPAIKLDSKLWIVIYIAVGLGIGFCYLPAREHMASQTAWAWIIKSNITFNFILIFFIWGLLCDKISKEKGWKTNGKRSWIMFFIGIVLLVFVFRFLGGMPTRW